MAPRLRTHPGYMAHSALKEAEHGSAASYMTLSRNHQAGRRVNGGLNAGDQHVRPGRAQAGRCPAGFQASSVQLFCRPLSGPSHADQTGLISSPSERCGKWPLSRYVSASPLSPSRWRQPRLVLGAAH